MVSDPNTGQCASEEVEPRRGWIGRSPTPIGEGNERQRGHWASKRGDCYKWYESQTSGNVPVKRLSPKGGWTVRSHIGWRGEQNTLYKGVKMSCPTLVGEENKPPFIRV